jgi:exopolyphosphatase/guanosine-5'-triphosphate,3'-diphosphate pyrophosphatase
VTPVRVAVVDMGSNSTRLLVADVGDDGTVTELERESIVTRLGQGVDSTGALAEEAEQRVYAALEGYRSQIERLGAEVTVGVLTSAVRDASNGEEFAQTVRDRFGIAARAIPGDEEARLSYLGATGGQAPGHPTLVIDIGGGSTELIVGDAGEMSFHVSTQVGVVRHTERHLHSDPPTAAQLAALREDAAATFAAAIPEDVRSAPERGIAVAGTATQCAAIVLGAYDRARVQGHVLERAGLEDLLARLAALPLEQRREVPGLDPERAPTIVAGAAILLEATATFGLERVEVSENDILRGAALGYTAFLGPATQL